ncbi:MarR family winged helix-turn-helix transcriptional regulator [Amycolatopsis taiwanensis]|uniref:MarR family winged helix-turn-helix transcriptional regulator n=1 Tax=Amycolatopsis taiwanensis TaxID=342230 RepID=UPI002555C2D6|nr:MarR family transcriptional regulator [Amycolatopsis taiwanensis]
MAPTTGYLMWRTVTKWRTAVDRALAPIGLTHAQFSVLGSLSGLSRTGQEPSQRELADVTGLEPVYVSKLVRALEKAGIVRRPVDPRDPRAVRLSLTDHGRKVAAEAIDRVHAIHQELTGPIGGPDGEHDRRLREILLALLGETPSLHEKKGTNMTAPTTVISRDISVAGTATRSLLDTLLDRNGLTFHQWVTLRTTVAHASATRETIIKEAAGIDENVVRGALDKIEADGLIGPDGDGLAPTAKGREVVQRIAEETARIASELYGGMSEEDLVTAKRVLEQVIERAGKVRASL